MTFLSNIPPFVFPLFAILLIIGIKSTRTRQVPVYVFYLLPFLGILAIRATASLHVDAVSWGLFGIAYVVAVFAGRALQNRFILGTEGGKLKRTLKLRGEYATLAMLMGIFALNFVKGAATGMAPELATSGTFVDAFALFGGAFSGLFLGRAWPAITAATTVANKASNSAAQTETDTQPPFAKPEITSQRC